MNTVNLYEHGGSKNHGCEAIVRSTVKVLGGQYAVTLFSTKAFEDCQFGLEKICNIVQSPLRIDDSKRNFNSMKYHFYQDVLHNPEKAFVVLNGPLLSRVTRGSLFFSIGGDLYCYDSWHSVSEMNNHLIKRGAKLVLWGCSVEPQKLESDPQMQADISRYSLITARESYSYSVLKKYNPNTLLVCDTAFLLAAATADLPEGFRTGKTVGINISPLVQGSADKASIVMDNYCGLIEWILQNTDEMIALIPHVTWEDVSDEQPLKTLFEKYKQSKRLLYIGNQYNCEQLKFIISSCSSFVGARTHATIAAYSSCVPTLTVGYSIKARGIARDLFGTEDGYVLSAQAMKERDELSLAFEKIYQQRERIIMHLRTVMPRYVEQLNLVGKVIKELE